MTHGHEWILAGTGQAGDTNLGYKTFLNGALVSNIVIDTSQVATDTIDYVATDNAGLTATSTRTVIVEAAANTATATSTNAPIKPRLFACLFPSIP